MAVLAAAALGKELARQALVAQVLAAAMVAHLRLAGLLALEFSLLVVVAARAAEHRALVAVAV
jgi:hypothetical protein